MSNQPRVVTSLANPLATIKAYIALATAIATGLSGMFVADSTEGKIITAVIAIGGALATYQFPNAQVVPVGANPSGQEYEDGFDPNAASMEEFEPYDYDSPADAERAYQPRHVDDESEVWADEADTGIEPDDDIDGDVEEDEPDTPLPLDEHEGFIGLPARGREITT